MMNALRLHISLTVLIRTKYNYKLYYTQKICNNRNIYFTYSEKLKF